MIWSSTTADFGGDDCNPGLYDESTGGAGFRGLNGSGDGGLFFLLFVIK